MITITVSTVYGKKVIYIHDSFENYLSLGEEYLHYPIEELLKIFEQAILDRKIIAKERIK